MYVSIDDIAYRRLTIIGEKLRKKFDKVIGLKLSGSISEGHYFYLQFGDEYVSSDYDVIVLLNDYPEKDEIENIIELIRTPVFNDSLEYIILRDIDVKLLTTAYPYRGKGVKIASVYDPNSDVQRHLIGGKIIFGEKYFKQHSLYNRRILRQIIYRISRRRKIIDSFIELGYLDRIVTILGQRQISTEIRGLVRKYKNYHMMSDDDIKMLSKKIEHIKKNVKNIVDKSIF